MRKAASLVLTLFFVISPAWAHPLPPGYCDNTTILSACLDACKDGAGRFETCFLVCLRDTTCEDLLAVHAEDAADLFVIKSASDTPQIEGVWVGTVSISSTRGSVEEPAELIIDENNFGSVGGYLVFRPGDPTWDNTNTLVEELFGTVEQDGLAGWSVSLAFIAGNFMGRYTEGGLFGEDRFDLEIVCSRDAILEPHITFECPFSGFATFEREP